MSETKLVLALPSKGRIYKPTIEFLQSCGLNVRRENDRQYQAPLTGIEGDVEVLFQRPRDIPKLIEEGGADLGITGFDMFMEAGGDQKADRLAPVFPDERDSDNIPSLPFGGCSLVIAVPENRVDIQTISDLAEYAMARKREGKILRVATEFPNLAKEHLFKYGVSYFESTEVFGAAESAPRRGAADIIADLTSSGVTLSENRLKQITGGTILKSSMSLIASTQSLKDKGKRKLAKQIIDRIEARLNAKSYQQVTANINCEDESKLAAHLTDKLKPEEIALLGQAGPTVAKVLTLKESNDNTPVFSISVQIETNKLDRVIDILRKKGCKNILVNPVSFVFDMERAYRVFEKKVKK